MINKRQDQAPRLSVRRMCTRRQTLSEDMWKSVRTAAKLRSSGPQLVKVFESIAGRYECNRGLFSDVNAVFAAILPVLFVITGRIFEIL